MTNPRTFGVQRNEVELAVILHPARSPAKREGVEMKKPFAVLAPFHL